MSIFLGLFFLFNKLAIAITKPGVQKPHWLPPWLVNASWIGLGLSFEPMPSIVRISEPETWPIFNKHELAGRYSPPLIGDNNMLHAPQSPSAHPSFVPLRSFSILIQSSKLELVRHSVDLCCYIFL